MHNLIPIFYFEGMYFGTVLTMLGGAIRKVFEKIIFDPYSTSNINLIVFLFYLYIDLQNNGFSSQFFFKFEKKKKTE